jgi:endonuclease/exonuclease/phosphatase family metal-dependent hydrolase
MTLLTINTWKCDGDYRARLSLLQNQLATLQADVVAMQEVFQAGTAGTRADTARQLADALDMGCAVAPSRQKQRLFDGEWTDSASGLAVLARFPIVANQIGTLPMDERDGERLAHYVHLDLAGRSLLIINTHLSHLRGASALRQAQLTALLDPLTTNLLGQLCLGETAFDAVFLCGDFNAESRSPELQFLANYPRFSVQDTYRAGKGTLPGTTMPADGSPNPGSGKRIDFIWSLASASDRHPVVQSARVVLDQPDATGNFPSDHRGVFITIQFPQPSPAP